MKKLLFTISLLLGLTIPIFVFAVNVTVQAPQGNGMWLVSSSTAWYASSTQPINIGFFNATSTATNATSSIKGNLLVSNCPGEVLAPSGLFGSNSSPQIETCTNVDDLITGVTIRNISPTANAAACLTYENDVSPGGAGISATNFVSDCLGSSKFNSIYIPGLHASDWVHYNASGNNFYAAASATAASSSQYWCNGPGFFINLCDMALTTQSGDTAFLGIGTSTPHWRLQAAGVRPFFVLSDTNSSLNAKHWFMASEGGNLFIGTSSDAFATTTHFSIANGGNTGIGTANPLARLDVQGPAAGSLARFTNTTAHASNQGAGMIGYSDSGSALSSGDRLGFFVLGGAKDSAHTLGNATAIESFATEAWSGTATGADLRFSISQNTQAVRTEAMRILNSTLVGISTTTPIAQLNVVGTNTGTITTLISGTSASQTADIFRLNKNPGATAGLIFSAGGSLGIASSTPWRKLDVGGTVSFKGLTTGSGALTGGAYLCLSSDNEVISDSATCLSSSETRKNNIKDLESVLDEVMKLKPKSFFYKPTGNPELDRRGEQVGFVAEDVVDVDPRFVEIDKTGKPYTVKYETMVSLLTKAIQEQQDQINSLQKRIERLEKLNGITPNHGLPLPIVGGAAGLVGLLGGILLKRKLKQT